ncbi:MAG: hydroxymethylbilane synthase, partial [Candidatus Dormiibacterota bacterium]
MIALATRGSALARAQAELAMTALRSKFPEEEFQAVVVDSDGDLSPATLAPDLPGQGWFTSRLERALLSGQLEGAVHSAKDLPTDLSPELVLAGFLPRGDPRDALVTPGEVTLSELSPGARVGTSSPRRAAQLLALRPDLAVLTIRGNVDTRVRKVHDGEFDACVIALAG